MKTGIGKESLCLAGLAVAGILAAAVMGQTAVGAGQSGTPSIVDRVQREDDPELKELIGIAATNHKYVAEQTRLDLVRKVTQSYAQIKLLDQQIDQLGRKIAAEGGLAEVRYELVLAKAELEAKRTTELASLRELMGIVPRFSFEKQLTQNLNAWVNLQIVDQRVVVLDGLRPFIDYWADERYKMVGVFPEKETLDYLRGRLKDRNSLPMRIVISYKPPTKSATEDLRQKIVALAQEANAEMDTEVRTDLTSSAGSDTSTFFIRNGKIRTLYPAAVRRPDATYGGVKRLVTGLVDPNELEQSILWRVTKPMNIPLTFRIEYDEASAKLARQVADRVKDITKRLGITDLVNVAGVSVEPVPETAFLGRWQPITQGVLRSLDVQPKGECQATMGEGAEVTKAGTSVKGIWFPTTKEIIIDVGDHAPGKPEQIYRGYLNAEGNLLVDKIQIYPQGSYIINDLGPTVLKKAY